MSNEITQEFGEDPIQLCKDWLADATESELNDPEAVNLATCSADGAPHNRWVLIKQIDEKGFKFHTHSKSQKGRDLEENPKASICFYWKSTRKQIRIEGTVEKASTEESDDYFKTRPIERQIGAWASQQSQPYEKKEDLQNAVKKYEEQFAGVDNIPRPEYWQGYRVIPERMEFWIAHKDRIHTRFQYAKNNDGSWDTTWLCP